MKKYIISISLLVLFLCGCNKITNEDLIGGTWYPIDGENNEDSNCGDFVNGIEFVNNEKAITEEPEMIYEYKISDGKSKNNLYLYIPRFSTIDLYSIDKFSKNEMILQDERYSDKGSCHLERLP